MLSPAGGEAPADEIEKMPDQPRRQIGKKKNHSRYFCINEAGQTQWLTENDGELIVDFVARLRDRARAS